MTNEAGLSTDGRSEILVARGVHVVQPVSRYAAVAIRDGRFAGFFATLRDARRAATRSMPVRDCGPVHIFPGFRDTHIHQLHTSLDMQRVSLDGARSIR